MWCGTKSGKIYIFHAKTYAQEKGVSVGAGCQKVLQKTVLSHTTFLDAKDTLGS